MPSIPFFFIHLFNLVSFHHYLFFVDFSLAIVDMQVVRALWKSGHIEHNPAGFSLLLADHKALLV